MELTELLQRIQDGDQLALDAVIPVVYEELKRLAGSHIRRENRHVQLDTTSLVHEAYLRMVDQNHPRYANRLHFYSIASHLMRQILVDLARQRNAQKRGPGIEIPIAGIQELGVEGQAALVQLDDALLRLAAEHPRKAQLIEMRYFGGMTAE